MIDVGGTGRESSAAIKALAVLHFHQDRTRHGQGRPLAPTLPSILSATSGKCRRLAFDSFSQHSFGDCDRNRVGISLFQIRHF